MIVPQSYLDLLSPNRGRKMILIHTPKCGGSAVSGMFGRRFRRCPTLVWPEAAGHLTYLEYRDIFAARGQDIHDHYLMATVRNPWAWHLSWFTYIRADRDGRRSGHRIEAELFARFDFSDYLDWLEDPQAPRSPQGYITRRLHEWMTDESGAIAVNRVLRQEHLDEDVAALVAETGVLLRPLRQRNVSNRKDYRSFYTPEQVDRVAARHARDLELFGYRFE